LGGFIRGPYRYSGGIYNQDWSCCMIVTGCWTKEALGLENQGVKKMRYFRKTEVTSQSSRPWKYVVSYSDKYLSPTK
jgi:hypothetical protein